jgi:LysR family glycine cleavage system transcriptional activator
MRKTPPLHYLQAFEAAARHKSFTEAARELNCTQSSISQRIRGLEAIFGRPLFQRLPNCVLPTASAEIYLKGIAEALDQLSSITRGLAGIKEQTAVSVSLPVSLATLWLAPRLGHFTARHPEIDVRLNCTIWDAIHSDATDFYIEVFESNHSPSESCCLTRDRAYVVCAPAVAQKLKGGRSDVFFEDQPLITLIAKYDYWELWRRKVGASRIGNGRKIEVDATVTALEIARNGHGVAISPHSYALSYLRSGDLVAPFDSAIDLELSHVLFSPVGRQLGRSAELFKAFLIEQAAEISR